MNRYMGVALMASVLAAQMQLESCAQSQDQVQPQVSQLQPAMTATAETNLRGPIGSPQAAQPFSTSSSYSYSEPNTEAASSSVESPLPAPVSAPVPSPELASPQAPKAVATPSSQPSTPTKSTKQKRHGFSPVGAVFGMQDRAFKSSLGLTDRTAKAGLGVTGKTTKELLKAIF